jgi:hypothetical protein
MKPKQATGSKFMNWLNEGHELYKDEVVVDSEDTFAAGWTSAMKWLRDKMLEDDVR